MTIGAEKIIFWIIGLMGRKSKMKVPGLAKKLLCIRELLGVSQSEMLRLLNISGALDRSIVSAYERGTREPPLTILLAYARVANVYVDVLINPELNLPDKIPSLHTSPGISINRKS